jgi:uncharacterized protein (DUF433 family)
MTKFEHITANPKIFGGKPIIKGTRISVEFILELLASGGSIQNIVESYSFLTPEAVKEAIDFANFQLKNEVEYELMNAA